MRCPKCGAKKEKIINFNKQNVTIHIPCECEQKENEEQEKARKKREAIKKANAILPGIMQSKWSFELDDKKNPGASTICKRYSENFKRGDFTGLLLFGDKGTGKTFMMCCIINRLIERGFNVDFTSLSEIVRRFESGNKEEHFNNLMNKDALFIDDIGTERDSSYMMEYAFDVIDGRYKRGKAIIASTNLSMVDMWNCQNITLARIFDRIMEMCYPVEFKGESRRVENAAKMRDEINKKMLAI